MAKKGNRNKTLSDNTAVTVTPVMLSPSDLQYYYVNHIEVSSSKYEFAITAGRLPARFTDEQKQQIKDTQKLIIEPNIQLLIPANLISGLINALTIQKESYEKHHGKLDTSE